MQTRTVINKVRWIRSLLSDELEEWLFLLSDATEMRRGGSVAMIHDASRFAELVSRDAAAVQIVRAFHLSLLADREEFVVWLDQPSPQRILHCLALPKQLPLQKKRMKPCVGPIKLKAVVHSP